MDKKLSAELLLLFYRITKGRAFTGEEKLVLLVMLVLWTFHPKALTITGLKEFTGLSGDEVVNTLHSLEDKDVGFDICFISQSKDDEETNHE